MINRFRVQNYKALRDVELNLTPMHVLIGPNDTGKTSILEAIAAICRSVEGPLSGVFPDGWSGRELMWRRCAPHDSVGLFVDIVPEGISYSVTFVFHEAGRQVKIYGESLERESATGMITSFLSNSSDSETWPFRTAVLHEFGLDAGEPAQCNELFQQLSGVRFHRWVPDLLALPVGEYSRSRFGLEPSGFGLALCLDDILGDDRDRFEKLESCFRAIFPEIKQIKFRPEPAFKVRAKSPFWTPMLDPADGKGLHFKLAGGGTVPAAQMSDGVLLVLAYLAILKSPEPPRLLLIEEPENGVHPKRLEEVLMILRDLVAEQDRTQVIMTTHSPYVLDHFKPEEVTLCTKGDDGAVNVRRLSESKTVREQIKTFTLGEIWTAEGDDALAQPIDADEEVAS